MTAPDPKQFRFAGYIITTAREFARKDRRVPRFVTAHRFIVENCVYSHEMDEPGHWDDFRLDRTLKENIPARVRNSALEAVSRLASDSALFGRPNVCMNRDSLRALLAAARVPRNLLQILEVGMRPADAEAVLDRERQFPRMQGEREQPHGMVVALGEPRLMSGEGAVLGFEPWYLDKRLRHSWRERHDMRAVRSNAFSRLNPYGLLSDMIDFELFLPGLTPRVRFKREAKWIPVLLVQHAVESIIGDQRTVPARAPQSRST